MHLNKKRVGLGVGSLSELQHPLQHVIFVHKIKNNITKGNHRLIQHYINLQLIMSEAYDQSAYSAFYNDDNEFCYQNRVSRFCVNPRKIFTSTFKSMNTILQQYDRPRDIELRNHYIVIFDYFRDPVSKPFIAMLDESEWKFWFIHVITHLRKLKTSPEWKQDGELDTLDKVIMGVCVQIFKQAQELNLVSEKSFQVPMEFFREIASCIDTLTPRLPRYESIQILKDICNFPTLAYSDCTGWRIMEKSGLLVQYLRFTTVPTNHMEYTYSTYSQLTKQVSFIKKKFKAGQPCGDMIHKILAGKEGHSSPDPKVLNFLQTLSQLADKANASQKMCQFCKTTKSEDLLKLCSYCRITYYCSKECQRNDWKNHKKYYCLQKPGLLKKNVDGYDSIGLKFLVDHQCEISAKVIEAMSETGRKIKELILELDFVVDESGVAPALSNPPQFEILNVENAHEYLLQKKYTNDLLKALPSQIRDLKENDMSVIWRSPISARITKTSVSLP